ncbi:hypothetical protein CPB83DRAFT_873752 [Crepidotus variabilis]|uniref:F-box domain-containing protein n=1 Tax=Crepidotus variabilis TaxID=179855 RepID=A0A9P6EQ42_9AGAR|nr:hypothetical protein CPB83DRAFT_873752 [Crepidotus variabilis]
MTTYPARIPASVFTQPRRRKPSLKAYIPVALKPRSCGNVDDVYVPRTPTFMSIAYLREAISTIDLRMATLVKERAELETKLETAVRLQSPILRLPSELLSNIFTIGVLETEEDPVMVPTLMLVCRYWAEVALNTPVLWAKISVSAHDSVEKAQRRLNRSKSCPLDVTVNFGPRLEYISNQAIGEHIVDAMELFRPSLWRIKSFSLTVPNRPQAYTALLRCQEDAPILENLTINVHHSMQDDRYSNPPLPLFNGCTPKLRSCSLTSFNFGWDLKLMTGLRVLKLGGYFNSFAPSPSTLLDILRQCPDLEELTLRNMSDLDADSCQGGMIHNDAQVTSKIHLPRLKTASFYYSGIGHTREILSHIAFPNLEHLELSYLENINPLLQDLYEQGLTRLPLKNLRIESCMFNEMKLVNLLRKLPSLVSLQLADIEDITYITLKALSSHQPWACPRLESVTLNGCTSFDWDSLRAFVESRLPADPHAYKRYHTSAASIVSSASAAAADYARMQSRTTGHTGLLAAPQRLRMVDVTRCNQISREMLQWLRMYVETVKCEAAKGIWGEPISL